MVAQPFSMPRKSELSIATFVVLIAIAIVVIAAVSPPGGAFDDA